MNTSKSCPEAAGTEPVDAEHIDAEHEPELTDEDILDAMRHVEGYLDISTEDFRIIYHLAWKHAVARLRERAKGGQR
jgi:CBS-domain-containing membrane protein